jgi:hypothetical protein
LSKLNLASTSPGGIAAYGNDYQNNLSNIHYHSLSLTHPAATGQACILAIFDLILVWFLG